MRLSIIGALLLACTSPVVLADNVKPTVTNNVVATPLSDSSVRVTWSKPYDNVGVDGYNIYRDSRYYATVHNRTNFVDTRVTAGQSYDYAIVAFDRARNYTVLSASDEATPGGSNSAGATPLDSGNGGPPVVATGLRAEVLGSDRISLFWNGDSTGATAGYNIYRNGRYHATMRGTRWTDSGLSPDTDYRYNLVSFNSRAQFSSHTSDIAVRTSGGNRSSSQPDQTAASPDAGVQSSGGVPSGYKLVFNDEFNGRDIDSSKWNSSYRWGPNWTINNEQQYYIDRINNPDFGRSPFSFNNGKMTITATKTPDNLKSSANYKSYLSGALTTYKKFKMRYGYVEMRAKMPRGQGLWPAFWMLNQYDNGQRPEIDIMEFLGRDVDTVYNVYHYYPGGRHKASPSYEVNGPDYTADFHTFGMQWEPGKITWYVDGRAVNTHTSGVSNEEMYIIVNLALGGSWGGNVDGSTPFPARYVIDYIRAYKR